jgi:adenine-specific DNA-methyltransferase
MISRFSLSASSFFNTRDGEKQSLLNSTDRSRKVAAKKLEPSVQTDRGQFFTPAPIAHFMASLFSLRHSDICLLDAGAGVGILTSAFIARALDQERPPESITSVMWETDPDLRVFLAKTVVECDEACSQKGVNFTGIILPDDFIYNACEMLESGIFSDSAKKLAFNCAILNPPYRKIHTDSVERKLLRRIEIETTNLYTAFVHLALRLLLPHGQLVAITPRSFCNGTYFYPFRRELLTTSSLTHVHTFTKRNTAFSDHKVLQENIIFKVIKGSNKESLVCVSSSEGPEDETLHKHRVEYNLIVSLSDPELVIHVPEPLNRENRRSFLTGLRGSLGALRLSVSTGRVVDFRLRDRLRLQPDSDTVPLIYPVHFSGGEVVWPKANTKKPNAIAKDQITNSLLVPSGYYVLVKRFSSKEEPRRIVAALLNPERIGQTSLAFENHVNYFHHEGGGLSPDIARGLTTYLNTTAIDQYFRQFSGHTQVNASDLRRLPYPSQNTLKRIGVRVDGTKQNQNEIDEIVEQEIANEAECKDNKSE